MLLICTQPVLFIGVAAVQIFNMTVRNCYWCNGWWPSCRFVMLSNCLVEVLVMCCAPVLSIIRVLKWKRIDATVL